MRVVFRIAALALAFIGTSAWAGPVGFPLSVTDDGGAVVTLPAPPSRIASLTLTTDEMLFSLVDPGRILGVTSLATDPSLSNVSAPARAVPHHLELNVETLLSLSPDLLLVANWTDPAPVRQLRQTGVPVYLMASGTDVASIERKIERLALLCGVPDRGRQVVQDMERRLQAVTRKLSAAPVSRRLTVIDYGSWGGSMGRGSSWDDMLRRAGLVNGVDSLAADEWGQVPLSREKLLELDPDILILPGGVYSSPSASRAFYEQVTGDPALKSLRALRTGRVYQMPESLKSTTSQYIVDAVEWLARTAYPELFR